MTYTVNKTYLFWAVLLLILELGIGFFVHDAWIRPYLGDFLVVILLYCIVSSFLIARKELILLGVLLFSYFVEMLQYFNFVAVMGLQDIAMARILIGTYFSWMDMLMYSLGVLLVYLIEMRNKRFTIKTRR
jgi:hypothetical protein